MAETIVRFVVGGLFVSFFSIFADALKPKSFAGLLSAAPSVALATITLTVLEKGRAYASIEAYSMIFGAVAFFAYACVVSKLLMRAKWSALFTTAICLSVWFGCAFGLWYVTAR
ncbi:MAG: DUF3147 family protein [Terriglobales bacterium]